MNIVSVAKKLGYRGPTKRLDHSRMYICTMFGLFFLSLSLLVIGPIPDSTLAGMDDWTQIMLSVCVLVGSLICIVGILLGTRIFRPKADIRICYQIGQWGIVSICISMLFYVIGVVGHVGPHFWGLTLSSALGLAILIGCAWVAIDFEYETERLDRKFKSEVKRISENEP